MIGRGHRLCERLQGRFMGEGKLGIKGRAWRGGEVSDFRPGI